MLATIVRVFWILFWTFNVIETNVFAADVEETLAKMNALPAEEREKILADNAKK